MRWFDVEYVNEAMTVDALSVLEVDTDGLMHHTVTFDSDDFDAAIVELDARYLAGEAAAHAEVWSVVAEAYAALTRHELPPATSHCVYVDHRKATTLASRDLTADVRAVWP